MYNLAPWLARVCRVVVVLCRASCLGEQAGGGAVDRSMDNDLSGPPAGGHAVVIGGSMAGLLAARALSKFFEHVTVVDRDVFPAEPAARRGVPQSRHVHAIATRGANGLEALFPGFIDDLAAAGVPHGDAQADFIWYFDGHRLAHGKADVPLYLMTRPLIESLVRDRVRRLANVTLAEQTEVTGLITEDGRVTGVQLRRENPVDAWPLAADLVVDAAGRGSRCLAWLAELGYSVPAKTTIRTNTVYVTRHFKQGPRPLQGRLAVVAAPFPGNPRGGVAVRQEGNQIAVMLAGMLGEEPPTDEAGMIAYAETLVASQIAEVLRTATPLDDAVKMRYPESSLKHFDKLDRSLEGYIVVGDALCTLNPIYGQGQTMAVLEAELLQSLLAEGRHGLSKRFFTKAAEVLAEPWGLATGGDLRFPQVEGVRNPQDEEAGQYLDQFRAAAATDPALGRSLLRVANMLAPISSLFDPDLKARVQQS